jgi:hypothetical protein
MGNFVKNIYPFTGFIILAISILFLRFWEHPLFSIAVAIAPILGLFELLRTQTYLNQLDNDSFLLKLKIINIIKSLLNKALDIHIAIRIVYVTLAILLFPFLLNTFST